MSGVLRGAFGGDKMLFASDSDDIHALQSHGITDSLNASAIYALTAGMDQELVTATFPTLVDSVQRGLVSEGYVDAAAARVLREKFALRLFDGPAYWAVNDSLRAQVLDAPAHRALSRPPALRAGVYFSASTRLC
jgi:beta-glucosidase-like glycosyl hydrolase